MTNPNFEKFLDKQVFEEAAVNVANQFDDFIKEHFLPNYPIHLITASLAKVIAAHIASYQILFKAPDAIERTIKFIEANAKFNVEEIEKALSSENYTGLNFIKSPYTAYLMEGE